MNRSAHATFSLQLHLVLVTKYRRRVITPAMLEALKEGFDVALADWRCRLLEFGGEPDHVHLLLEVNPAVQPSILVNNLKTTSSRRIRNRFPEEVARVYRDRVFWHRAYYLGSVGQASLDTVKRYVEAQRCAA